MLKSRSSTPCSISIVIAATRSARSVLFAAARLNDISYSQFMHGLKVAGIELDRKVLAQMAYEDIESFNELATIAKKALEA